MKIWKEWKIKLVGFVVVSFFISGSVIYARHDGQAMSNMPGMSKAKAKPKSNPTRRKRREATKKRQIAKKHDMSNMPGMNMPGMKMPAIHRRKTGRRRGKALPPKMDKLPSPQMQMNMPGRQMPKASPSASPQTQMNMPGMQMPQASPSASPQTQMNMPGMQMPSASPNPQASPQQKMDMNMPMPGASPSASPMGQMPGMDMGGMNMKMGPLLVMNGNDMGIRVGASDTNVMSMGAMGSGTTWQPSSGPMHMYHKQSGDWLLMFHYNVVAGLNRQGGPRGVTKVES